jgi:serine/threonine-protein kinase
MDWFTSTAPLPKVYSKLLRQGTTRIALDEQLGIDLIDNINRENNVIRSGFRNSGVSSQSRIIERHIQAKNGLPYWISYDFAALDGKGNIFANPIGPNGIELPKGGAEVSDKVFEHDGGEVIYQLPNGLFGYYLADSAGGQIDKGPTQIVKQQGAPEQFVSAIVNGVSCMSCHGSGLIHKADQIREFVQRDENEDQFSEEEREFVRRLYVQDAELQRLIAQDNEAYFEALKKLEIDYSKGDPVNDSFRIYNRSLTLNQVVAELDIESGNSLFNIILNSSAVKFIWANLNEVGAFLSREEFSLGIRALSKLELTRLFEIPAGGDYVITPNCMSKNPLLMNECFILEARTDEADR